MTVLIKMNMSSEYRLRFKLLNGIRYLQIVYYISDTNALLIDCYMYKTL